MILLYVTGKVEYVTYGVFDHFETHKPLPLGFISDLRDGVVVDANGHAELNGFKLTVPSTKGILALKNDVFYDISCNVHFKSRGFTFADANRMCESGICDVHFFSSLTPFQTHAL